MIRLNEAIPEQQFWCLTGASACTHITPAQPRTMAWMKRSISALDSDSVGSIIRVPVTGHDMVGPWKP